jgi:hypothetical protein
MTQPSDWDEGGVHDDDAVVIGWRRGRHASPQHAAAQPQAVRKHVCAAVLRAARWAPR